MTAQANNKSKLVLVDGSSYLFRAFYALPALKSPDGFPTGAIYGVINMLRKLVSDYQPDKMVVVFDPKGPNFRHELYADYKANRTQMPEDLRKQIEPLHQLIQLFGFPLLIESKVEADDVIGTLSRRYEKDYQVIIATGDKDIAQLIGPMVTIIDTMKGVTIDSDHVLAKFGVKPEQMIDFLTIAGDSSDNIPGVSGVGPKTAAKWLQTYETLENLVAHVDEIKGKAGLNLKDALDQLPLYRELVTIKADLDLAWDEAAMEIKLPDTQKLLVELASAAGMPSPSWPL